MAFRGQPYSLHSGLFLSSSKLAMLHLSDHFSVVTSPSNSPLCIHLDPWDYIGPTWITQHTLLKIPNLFTSAEFLLPYKATHSQVPEIGMWTWPQPTRQVLAPAPAIPELATSSGHQTCTSQHHGHALFCLLGVSSCSPPVSVSENPTASLSLPLPTWQGHSRKRLEIPELQTNKLFFAQQHTLCAKY